MRTVRRIRQSEGVSSFGTDATTSMVLEEREGRLLRVSHGAEAITSSAVALHRGIRAYRTRSMRRRGRRTAKKAGRRRGRLWARIDPAGRTWSRRVPPPVVTYATRWPSGEIATSGEVIAMANGSIAWGVNVTRTRLGGVGPLARHTVTPVRMLTISRAARPPRARESQRAAGRAVGGSAPDISSPGATCASWISRRAFPASRSRSLGGDCQAAGIVT